MSASTKYISKIKRFSKGDRVWVQAQHIWLILTAKIMMEKDDNDKKIVTITYGELAERMGYTKQAGRTLARALGIVGKYCEANDIPTINSIVVNQETGLPGDHVVTRKGYTYKQEQKACMKQDWFSLRVPTTGTFRTVWELNK